MAHVSPPSFCTLHALRIKGFAKCEILADITLLQLNEVEGHLREFLADGKTAFRENRGLWQLTPVGREAHRSELAEDSAAAQLGDGLSADYRKFLELNELFKALCGDWQLRDGAPNDHTDARYDAAVIDRLGELDAQARPIVDSMADLLGRLSPYSARFVASHGRLRGGEVNMFTGVMCGSYHDVWMELHEDLILTQGINRAAEGSF